MFLPTTEREMKKLGWQKLDVILVTGDSYIDSPFIGVAVIGKVLLKAGFRVGIIAQPDINSGRDITRLGEPELFWGVTGGSVDSLVANYTASKKRRKTDDYTPGGINNRRPNRAVIAYTNLIRHYFKNTRPIVLGGIEASLRRITHYDFWSNSIRRSILFDAKADILVYGMAENTIVNLANALKHGESCHEIHGLCYIAKEKEESYIELPSFRTVTANKNAFIECFNVFYSNNDPLTAKGLCQKHDSRYLIQNSPAPYLSPKELDKVYDMDFERDLHPYYQQQGPVRALETIKFSLTTHRGCYGECNFCAIAVHEGRTVRWRSEASILQEARKIAQLADFKGYILDVGGPTANMYGYECKKKITAGSCPNKRCLYPKPCAKLPIDHRRQIRLLNKLRKIAGVKKVFVASGIRYDLILNDREHGLPYLKDLVLHHISGQMKVAPEHTEGPILKLMGKPGKASLLEFKALFEKFTKAAGKDQYLTYYLMAAHPGCRDEDMKKLKTFAEKELKIRPQQVQIFTPTPSTYSSLMYYTELDPFTRKKLFVEKDTQKKERQKYLVVKKRR